MQHRGQGLAPRCTAKLKDKVTTAKRGGGHSGWGWGVLRTQPPELTVTWQVTYRPRQGGTGQGFR